MTRRRWIADEVSNDRAYLTGAHAQHLVRVLRARVGQEFDIVTGESVRRGIVMAVDEARVEFALGDQLQAAALNDVTLMLSVFKFDRMEWAIEKCTELGVARIVPLIAKRTDSHLAAAAAKRVERWRRIAVQASEQSRRALIPEIGEPLKLKRDAITIAGEKLLLAESEDQVTLGQALGSAQTNSAMTIAVGPEGGWTDEEVTVFIEAGWKPVSLGPTILRAETAAIAALALAMMMEKSNA